MSDPRSYWVKLIQGFYYRLTGYFPHRLPSGIVQFDAFFARLCMAYDFPYSNDAFRQAFATMIMHLDPTTQSKAPYWFAKALRKSQANQVAYDVIQSLKSFKDAQQYSVS